GFVMPRTAVCVICAMLASVAAALLLLMPSSALAQDPPKSEVTLGGTPAEGVTPLRLVATLKMLGSEDAVPGFKLLVMAKYTGHAHENATTTTNDKGEVAITLNRKPDELRVFAY